MTDAIVQSQHHVCTREEAISSGLKWFFTGIPCRRGHLALRRSSNGHCRDCEIVRHAENYPKNREKIVESQRERRKKNPKYTANYLAKRQAWRQANPAEARAMRRAEYVANKENYQRLNAKWYAENRDRAKALAHARRALLLSADGSHGVADVRRLFSLQKAKCAHCHTSIKDGYHIDHVIPLARGGGNGPDNLQLLCPFCNLSKGAKDPIQWKQESGMLL